MMFFPTCSISSRLKISLIFCQIPSNHSLMAFHFSSIVDFTLSQISDSLSLMLLNISDAESFKPFQSPEANSLIFPQIDSHTPLITPSTVLIILLIAVIRVFVRLFIASHIWLKNVLMPSHAFFQSPVKIPVIKSIKPPSASNTWPRVSLIPFHQPKNMSTSPDNALPMIGTIVPINHKTNGLRKFSHTVVIASATFPVKSRNLSIRGLKYCS